MAPARTLTTEGSRDSDRRCLLALARDVQAAATLRTLVVDTSLVQPTIDRQHTCD
jgi:hypothetical protein